MEIKIENNNSGRRKSRKPALILAVIVAILLIGYALTDFIADWIWFSELGYVSVFFTEMFTKIKLGVPVFVVSSLIAFAALVTIKKSFLKKNELKLKDASSIKRVNRMAALLSVIFGALLTAGMIPRLWFQILQLIYSTDFGVTDPLFGNDVSFYVFKLEFWNGINDLATKLIVMLFIISLVYHTILVNLAKPSLSEADTLDYSVEPEHEDPFAPGPDGLAQGVLLKMIRNFTVRQQYSGSSDKLKNKGSAVLSVASRQFSILAVLLFISIAFNFFLKRYGLLYRGTGVAYGAGYTDINVTLKVYIALIALSLVSAVLVPLAISRRKWKLGVAVPLLMLVIWFAGGLAAMGVQSLVVSPDELNKEGDYLNNNITYTRLAYDLQNISVRDMEPDNALTAYDVLNNMETFSNIRINDFEPTERFYNQTQSIRSYYTFNDVDVDRYYVNGEYTQCFLSAREIDQSRIEDSWLIKHLKYTHGYGLTLSRVDKVTGSGQPDILIESIPPVSEVPEISITRPEIYYGESTDSYVITGTSESEFDYPSGESNVYCEYEGEGGIKLSFFKRLLFALRERSLKILISTNINSDSRIHIYRNIAERVRKIAPFLIYDDDPYVVTVDGRIYWIVDAYTVSSYYPYSEPWNEGGDANYIRNSVKVIIDAYNGSADFYLIDGADPVAVTLSKIYPELFKDFDSMPEEFKAHLQYPNALFNIQAAVYEKYHMTDVDVFYQREDLWKISDELYGQEKVRMTPNYFIMKLPGEENVEFVSTIAYTPSGKSNLTGILMARSDGDYYGQIVLYRMPKDRIIYGPEQIEAQINQNAEISKEFSLWNNSGSSYSRGNMFVIPVENSLLYVEPVYLEASSGSLPEVKRVIVYYGDKVAYESTLAECLNVLFGYGAGDPLNTPFPIESGRLAADALAAGLPMDDGEQPGEDGPAGDSLKELAAKAAELYEKAVEAQKSGDWAAYGRWLKQLGDVIAEMAAFNAE